MTSDLKRGLTRWVYIADKQGDPVDPEGVDCIREYPSIDPLLVPPGIKGDKFDLNQWKSYRKKWR